MSAARFTVLGEALIDLVQPGPGDLYRALPAGGPLNIAVGLRRLGHPTALMARFSRGALGARIRSFAEQADLDLRASVDSSEQATLAFATVDDSGKAQYDFYVDGTSDWAWTADELTGLAPDTTVVHAGSLSTAIDPGARVIRDWWARLASAGDLLLSFDPNVRPRLAGVREEAAARVEGFVGLAHVVKASDEDLAWLYPEVDPETALLRWATLGPALVVLTRGGDGCVALTPRGHRCELPSRAVDVIDTIGAGDAFQAGLLSGLADEGVASPDRIAAIDAAALERVLQRALTVASITCTRAGADPPTRADYELQAVG